MRGWLYFFICILLVSTCFADFDDYSLEEVRAIGLSLYGDYVPNHWRVFPVYPDPNAVPFAAVDHYPSLNVSDALRIHGDLINYPRDRSWDVGALESRSGGLNEDLRRRIEQNWGSDAPEGDLNMDGTCDLSDYVILVRWWDWWEVKGKEKWEPIVRRLGIPTTPPVIH